MSYRSWIGSFLLVIIVIAAGGGLAAWKYSSIQHANAESAAQPEPMESVSVAISAERKHRQTLTSIGTVTALRSITLRNELAGTVRTVSLTSGQIVEAGTVLVTLDVSVEEAELQQQEAEAALAQSLLSRTEGVSRHHAVSQLDVDKAKAGLEVAQAQIARTKAIIARKTIRAPFRARVGIADVHPGQYLNEGTELTTLQGVDSSSYIDFTVAQSVAAGLHRGDSVEVFAVNDSSPIHAAIIAIDARVDETTRNAMVRAKIKNVANHLSPGASVRVRIPVGQTLTAVAIPVSALRKGPGGDHVFVINADKDGKSRAHMRKVQSGPVLGDEVLILSGLSSGEQVAASGSFKLREAALVAVSNEQPINPSL
jgi:membrane fusion protein (multidrug efflux system)